MTDPIVEQLLARVRRLEDESAIQRLIMTYGPAADSGLTAVAASVWLEDGVYDWDADGAPHEGSAAVDAMLQGEGHQGLIAHGVAHFAGPLLVEVDGDRATALNYSLVMRREDARWFLWRVSAVRWDVERIGVAWKVRRRTNRLLNESGAGLGLFRDSLLEVFAESPK
jgi:hypothetical protein